MRRKGVGTQACGRRAFAGAATGDELVEVAELEGARCGGGCAGEAAFPADSVMPAEVAQSGRN